MKYTHNWLRSLTDKNKFMIFDVLIKKARFSFMIAFAFVSCLFSLWHDNVYFDHPIRNET